MAASKQHEVVIIGAGPAGLTAAYDAQKLGFRPILFEHAARVGGIARTEQYKGYRFDIGGHRFYTKVPEVEALWHTMLAEQFQERPRLSRIYYDQTFFPYPIKLWPTLHKLGVIESTRILLSYLWAKLLPSPIEENFEQWVSNRFGKRLYRTFFKSYTEKVWGIPTTEIRAEWAAQRIKGLSFRTTVQHALGGNNGVKSLIETFHYPLHGPGMMWEAFQAKIEDAGGEVHCNATVTHLYLKENRVDQIEIRVADPDKGEQIVEVISAEHIISSMPLRNLIASLHPAPPPPVQAAAKALKYRGFLIVGLIIHEADLFPDNWIYIHEPNVKVGRIQNFKNWSAAMVPDLAYTSLGMEYFCEEGDTLWCQSDEALITLAKQELMMLGLANASLVVDGCVIRQPKAYPTYDAEYQKQLVIIREYLDGIENLQTIGRNGMHRYNNQDHSMLTGILAARNLAGESHDLWNVNTERSYYEEWTITPQTEPLSASE